MSTQLLQQLGSLWGFLRLHCPFPKLHQNSHFLDTSELTTRWLCLFWPSAGVACELPLPAGGPARLSPKRHLLAAPEESRQLPFCPTQTHWSVLATSLFHPCHSHSPICALPLPVLSLSNPTSAASLASSIHTHHFSFSVEGPVSPLVRSYLITMYNCLLL